MTRWNRYSLAVVVAVQLTGCSSSGASNVDASSSPCSVPGEILNASGQCVGDVGSYCGADDECATLRCSQGVCAAAPGPNGSPCATDTDCTSSVCDTATSTCGAQPNGTGCERDLECASGICACGAADDACSYYGGATCGPRPVGGRCGRDEDCTSGACDVTERRCVPQSSGSTHDAATEPADAAAKDAATGS
jgi:hypothetical protein